jgi:YHS domain-containing protein
MVGNPVDPSVPTSVYRGRVIGFCCPACKPRFDANPEAYAANIR